MASGVHVSTGHALFGIPMIRQARELLGVPVDLWYATLPDTLPGDPEIALLSALERDRVSRLRIPERAAAGAWSRVLVRAVMAGHLGCEPRKVPIVESTRGKPMLDSGTSAGLHFNVSHSGQQWLAAVTRDVPVGVDIEARRVFKDAEQLARRAFGVQEQEEYRTGLGAGLSPSDAFLRVWTSVEARSKALGSGIDRHGARAVVGLSRLPWCELEPPPRAPEFVGAFAVLR